MIAQTQLDEIARFVNQHGELSETLVNELRGEFKGVHFTYCSDDDICGPRPVSEQSTYNLYLIDSRNHCLNFTQDLEVATGVVIAELEEE